MIYFISSYPERGLTHGKKTVGVASYTKNLIDYLKSKIGKIVVFAEKFEEKRDINTFENLYEDREKYTEGDIEVQRVWKRNSMFSVINAFLRIPPNSTLIVPIEFYMFGGVVEMTTTLFMMMLLRLRGVKTISILHQVVENFDNLNEPFFSNILKTIFVKFYYFLIKMSSNKIVVFEEYFKKIIGGKNTVFIPHAIEISRKVEKLQSPKDHINLLYFGFVSPYKGIEDLMDKYTGECGDLIIAGGANPNHVSNPKYNEFIGNIFDRSEKEGIFTTGFLPEKDISKHFNKSDIVIFPYTNFFSSSGPLSLAFTYEKPVILSRPMIKYFESHDFKKAASEALLRPEDFVFDFKNRDAILCSKVDFVNKNREKYIKFAKLLKQERNWENIAKQYYEIIK